jgi:hypothetical protein
MKYAADMADKCGSATGERCEQALTFVKCLHSEVSASYDIKIF